MHESFDEAEAELALLAARGAGQPYLLALKLRDEPTTLHLRAYLGDPSPLYDWANINFLPTQVRELALQTSQKQALKWALIQSGGVVPTTETETALATIAASENPMAAVANLKEGDGKPLLLLTSSSPGYGLFFDPKQNHNGWSAPAPLSERAALLAPALTEVLRDRFPPDGQDDAAAETAEVDEDEIEIYRDQIADKDFAVDDSTATTKTRGSAQRVFAEAVKRNYGWRCAISRYRLVRIFLSHRMSFRGVKTTPFALTLPSGICLSLLVDRAFEKGYLIIEDDLSIRVDWVRVGDDTSLREAMEPFDGAGSVGRASDPPRADYLLRRRRFHTQRGK